MKRSFVVPCIAAHKMILFARPKCSNYLIEDYDDLELGCYFWFGSIRYGNISKEDLIALSRCGKARRFELYAEQHHFDPPFLKTLFELFTNECETTFTEKNLLEKKFVELQEQMQIPEIDDDGSWHCIISELKSKENNISPPYRTLLEDYLRNEIKLKITAQKIEIKCMAWSCKTLYLPEEIFSSDTVQKYTYIIKIDKEKFEGLDQVGIRSFFNMYELNVDEIVFNYSSVKITQEYLQQLKVEFLQLKRLIRLSRHDVFVQIKPHYIFDLEKRYNFMQILHEIDWGQYLETREIRNLFGAYDNIKEVIKPREKVPETGKFINAEKCLKISCSDGLSIREKYKFQATISTTECRNISLVELELIMAAVRNIGSIAMDYSEVDTSSEKSLQDFKMYVLSLKYSMESGEATQVKLTPADLFECDKIRNWGKILKEIPFEKYLATNDALNLYIAYNNLEDSASGYYRVFSQWRNRKNKSLSGITVELKGSTVSVSSSPNAKLYYCFEDERCGNSLEVLKTMLECFRDDIKHFELNIDQWPPVEWSRMETQTAFERLRQTVKTNSWRSPEIIFSYDGVFGAIIGDWRDNIYKLDLYDVSHFEKETTREYDLRTFIVELMYGSNARGLYINQHMLEMIFKFPHLWSLKLNLPYPKISNWTFLESTDIFGYQKLFPELRQLHIAGQESNKDTTVDDFMVCYSRKLQADSRIQSLMFTNCHLGPTAFQSNFFRPGNNNLVKLQFTNCIIDAPPSWFAVDDLEFWNMAVPISFLRQFNRINTLTLQNCENVTDEILEAIVTRQSNLKNVHISNCPVTDQVFMNMIQHQFGIGDFHASTINLPMGFEIGNSPQCCSKLIDIIETHDHCSEHQIFPRIVKTENSLQVLVHPAMEMVLNSENIPNRKELPNWIEHFKSLIIRIDWSHVHLIGANDFVTSLKGSSPDFDNELMHFFEHCGEYISSIKILVENKCHAGELKNRLFESIIESLINDVIERYCTNVKKILYLNPNYETESYDLPNRCPFLTSIEYTEVDSEYLVLRIEDHQSLQLEARKHVITHAILTNYSKKVTESVFKSLLKLPWLRELTMRLSYPNISSWQFLENIKCTADEQILPRVLGLSFISDLMTTETSIAFHDFHKHFRKLITHPIPLATLAIENVILAPETLENFGFQPAILEIECFLTTEWKMEYFSCFSNLKALYLKNVMPVLPPKSIVGDGFYLKLERLSKITDSALVSIMTGDSAVKSIIVSNCSISDNFFRKWPSINGCIV